MKQWFKSAAGIVSTVLLFFSILLICLVLFFIVPNYEESIAKDLLLGLSTNLLGIIVTVSFVQFFINRQNTRNEKEEETTKIKRFNKYTDMLIKRYQKLFYALTTRIQDRTEIDIDSIFDRHFKFSDMADMYRPSLYQNEALLEPTVVLFFRVEERLRESFLHMIEGIDFKYHAELYAIIQSFISESISNDLSGVIIGNKTVMMGDKHLTDEIAEMIGDVSNDWLDKLKRGELPVNHTLFPYVVFYFHLLKQVEYLKQYMICMKAI